MGHYSQKRHDCLSAIKVYLCSNWMVILYKTKSNNIQLGHGEYIIYWRIRKVGYSLEEQNLVDIKLFAWCENTHSAMSSILFH